MQESLLKRKEEMTTSEKEGEKEKDAEEEQPPPDTAPAASTSSGSQKPKVDVAAAVVKYCGPPYRGMGTRRSTVAKHELVMCDHCGEPIPTFRNDQLEIRRLLKQGKCKEACEQRTSCLYELCYGIRGQRVYFRLHMKCFNAFEPSLKERHQILLAGSNAEEKTRKPCEKKRKDEEKQRKKKETKRKYEEKERKKE